MNSHIFPWDTMTAIELQNELKCMEQILAERDAAANRMKRFRSNENKVVDLLEFRRQEDAMFDPVDGSVRSAVSLQSEKEDMKSISSSENRRIYFYCSHKRYDSSQDDCGVHYRTPIKGHDGRRSNQVSHNCLAINRQKKNLVRTLNRIFERCTMCKKGEVCVREATEQEIIEYNRV